MATLLNTTPAATYPALIKFSDNSAIGAALKYLSDGAGNNLPIAVSSSNVGINTTTGTGLLNIKGTGASSSTTSLLVQNSSGVNSFLIRDDGLKQISNGGIQFSYGSSGFGIGATNTGLTSGTPRIFANGSDHLFIEAGNTTNALMINSPSGNVGVGIYIPTSRLHVKGSGATSATNSVLVQNSSGSNVFACQDDGKVVISSNTLTVSGYGARINNLALGFLGSKTISSTDADSAVTITGSGVVVTGGGTTGTPNASALLQVDSTVRGFLPPRMTDAQVRAIASPAVGLLAYNTDLDCPVFYSAAGWRKVSHSVM